MQISLAGNLREAELETNYFSEFRVRRLYSYYYFDDGTGDLEARVQVMKTKRDRKGLFLDSGAFSAFTQGVEIDLDEYIAFIKKYKDFIEVYANLDVIGDPAGTWENQEYMESKGLHPLPIFHYGEDWRWLESYLNRHYDFIGLGGMAANSKGVSLSSQKKSQWLDQVFRDFLCDEEGLPMVKVHGFGLSSLSLIRRYPWWSVDSTTWVMVSRMGSVFVPIPWKGILKDPWVVGVSARSPEQKVEGGRYLSTFSPSHQETILAYFEEKGFPLGSSDIRKEKAGYKLQEGESPVGRSKVKKGRLVEDGEVEVPVEPGLSNEYRLRDRLNVIYYQDLEKALPEWPWPFRMKRGRGFDW